MFGLYFVNFSETQVALISSVKVFLSFDYIKFIMEDKLSQAKVDEIIKSME